jgi:hypothetical protein
MASRLARYGPFRSPAILIDSHLDCLPVHPDFGGPITNVHGSPECCDKAGTRTVSDLLFSTCPAAIARFVISIVVNAVELMGFARSAAHVGEKLFKAFSPCWANRYTAPAVSGVSVHGRVGATPNHRVPCAPFPAAAAISGFAVSQSIACHSSMMA